MLCATDSWAGTRASKRRPARTRPIVTHRLPLTMRTPPAPFPGDMVPAPFLIVGADGRVVDSNPLVFLEYSSAIRPLVELKLVEWEGLGLTLIQSDMIVEINQDDRFVAAKDSANVEMESIIAERLKDHPIEQDASIALWKSPSAAQEIIQKLESQIRQQSL